MDVNMSVECSCPSVAIATYTLEIRNDTFYFVTAYTYLCFPEPLFKYHHSFGEVNSPILYVTEGILTTTHSDKFCGIKICLS
jgi:hypothetical protein